MSLKFNPILNLKLMLKGSKTIKIMKGINKSKSFSFFFFATKKQKISIYYNKKVLYKKFYTSSYLNLLDYNKDTHAKKYCSWLCCTFWASYWRIKCKINWERTYLNVFITEPLVEKTVSFRDSAKKFRSSHQRCS